MADENAKFLRFAMNAKATLQALDEPQVTLRVSLSNQHIIPSVQYFAQRYQRDWNVDIEESARELGFRSAKLALTDFNEIFRINGSLLSLVPNLTNENTMKVSNRLTITH